MSDSNDGDSPEMHIIGKKPVPASSSAEPHHHEGFRAEFVTPEKEADETPTERIDSVEEEPVIKEASNEPPTTPLPTIDPQTRVFADAIKLAFTELRPKIIDMLLEVQRSVDLQHESEKEPDIEYHRRLHAFKVIIQLAGFGFAFVVLTGAYAYLAGNIGAALVGVLIISSAIVFGARFINKKQATIEDEDTRRKFKRWTRAALIVVSLALGVLFLIVEEFVGVSSYWSAAYLVISVVLLYFALMQYYKWSRLDIVRDGGVLRAQRPAKGVFFLPTLSRELYLNNVNDCNYAQTWIEEKLGMYRILIRLDADMPDPKGSPEEKEAYRNAKFWTNLKFIVNGKQLRDAIRQGSLQRKG